MNLGAKAVHDLDVLGVAHNGDAFELGGIGQQIVQEPIVCAVEPQVTPLFAFEIHEIFKGRDAIGFDVLGQLGNVQLVGGAEMKAIVDIATALGIGLLARVDIGVVFVVEEISEHGGESALGGINGFGLILGDFFSKAEMHVRVNEPWKGREPVCIKDGKARVDWGAWAHAARNLAIDHQHVLRGWRRECVHQSGTTHDKTAKV